ncbi:MAG: hypothetical protein KF770_15560 [Anaerolineae bacterium]|nr:hypothetical protein [Anaerolineae bacterium]
MNKTASSSKFGWRQVNLHTSATDGSRPRSVQAQQKAKSAFADWYQPT